MKAWIAVTLRSDTCFSRGLAGRSGDVDTEVEHDPRTGLPVLRGRTLKGLLVEELALLLAALEPARSGVLHEASRRLFGEPGAGQGGSLRVGDGGLPDDVVDAVEAAIDGKEPRWSAAQVRGALTTIRRQTRVDRDTGGPDEGSLRATRLLRAGLSFRHPLDFAADPGPHGRALLAGAALAVRRAGLHRNRGWGVVSLRVLDEAGRDVTLEWVRPLVAWNAPQASASSGVLSEAAARSAPSTSVRASTSGASNAALAKIAASPPGIQTAGAVAPATDSASRSAGRMVVEYTLRLTAPMLLGVEGGDPSTLESLRYAGGAAVLGAMAQRFTRPPGKADLAGGKAREELLFQELFLRGDVRWLNAYPAGPRGQRLLPAPRSWLYPKDKPKEPFDSAAPCGIEDPGCAAPATSGSTWFVEIAHEDDHHRVRYREPAKQVQLHQARDREAGRATETSGAIFSYVSLPAGERLAGCVLCENAGAAERVKGLLEAGPLHIGRSRSATYGGGAVVESIALIPIDRWEEAPRAKRTEDDEEPEPDRTVITLLSDYLGRNDRGQADPAALVPELRAALGLPDGAATCFLASRPVSGYVGKWQMPRPRHEAVLAGSVVVLAGRADPGRVRDLAWGGIGERRAEGFGRVAIDWHARSRQLKCEEIEASQMRRPTAPARGATTASAGLSLLRRSILLGAAESFLRASAVRDASATARPPSASLLARIRAVVRAAPTLAEVEGFFADLKTKNNKAGQTLERAELRGRTVATYFAELLSSQTNFATWSAMLNLDEKVSRPAGIEAVRIEEQRSRLTRLYLDAYCEALRRRSRSSDRAVELSRSARAPLSPSREGGAS
jgi:CRISPR-associated protein Csx10